MSLTPPSFLACLLPTCFFLIAAHATPLYRTSSITASPLPDSWLNYVISFWNTTYHDKYSIDHPYPSPSQSPFPKDAGESPTYIGFTKSEEGLNDAVSKHFVLNNKFYHQTQKEASLQVYKQSRTEFYGLMGLAEQGSLSKKQKKKWQKVIQQILISYVHESGAVFFDIAFSERWKYCGWVQMAETFVGTTESMRVCVSLVSLGLDNITRPPEEGKDYIIPGQNDREETREMLEPLLQTYDRHLLNHAQRQETFETLTYATVDLFGYPDYCEYPLDVDPNCYSFCCMTPYYGSAFCNDCMF